MDFRPRGICNALILFMFFLTAGSMAAEAKSRSKAKSTENNKYASIVIDAETGAILSQSNPDKVLHPASLTKLMTLSLAFEAIESGRLSPNHRIRVSQRAAAQSPSKIGLKAGETIRVQDAIYAVVTKSANDMSVALAEALAGSEPQFVRLMNTRAQSIGMNRTLFRNASGLPDPRQVSTARDMAKLARHIIHNQPRYYPIFNKRSFTYNGRTYKNHNRLLDSYAGLDGMKTGYVNASGFNLVASAKRNGQRIIGVVFGGQTSQSRNLHMAGLLDNGFSNVDRIRLASAAHQRSRSTTQGSAAAEFAHSLSPISTAYAATEDVSPDAAARIVPEAGTPAAYVPAPQDKLIRTGPAIAAMAAPQPAAQQQTPSRIQTVRVASLATASDTMTDAAPAASSVQPVYIPRGESHGYGMGDAQQTVQQNGWSVQVGAFQSRVATDQALYRAMNKLPAGLGSKATALIVPLRTADAAWVFRARLTGFTREEAVQACGQLQDCLTISPQAN